MSELKSTLVARVYELEAQNARLKAENEHLSFKCSDLHRRVATAEVSLRMATAYVDQQKAEFDLLAVHYREQLRGKYTDEMGYPRQPNSEAPWEPN